MSVEKFSVLMAVYHKERAANLRCALQSVQAQTLPPDEIVVVRDGPIGSELDAVLKEFSRLYGNLIEVSLPVNGGLGKALNAGLAACSNEIVARMDSDDISVPYRFERLVSRISADRQLSLVGSAVAEFNVDSTILERVRKVPLTHDEILRRFSVLSPVNHPAVVYRRSAVLECGGYASEFAQEDYHLWAKMLARGCRFENSPEALLLMRTGDGLYDRRGGLRYARSEIRLQREFLRLGLINIPQFLFNSITRCGVRMMPGSVRQMVYKLFLRSGVPNDTPPS